MTFIRQRSKFGNVRTEAHGVTFDSKGEAKRYGELLMLERAGQIEKLERQVSFKLCGMNGGVVTTYKADFVYQENGRRVVEDFKGFSTPLFLLKAKLFEDNYGYAITLTGRRK